MEALSALINAHDVSRPSGYRGYWKGKFSTSILFVDTP
jgi:hypothetical protein